MSTIANAVKANHEILAKLVQDNNGQQHAVLPDIPKSMINGETVHYSSADGEVTIEFRDDNNLPSLSPFLEPNGSVKTVITSAEPPITLSKRGHFFCHCFITPPGKARIGWDKLNSPQSGGNHDVQ
jgi:hypothetical protein